MLLMAGFVAHGLIGCILLRPASYYEAIKPRSLKDKPSRSITNLNNKSAVSELPDDPIHGRYSARNPAYVSDEISRDVVRRNGESTFVRADRENKGCHPGEKTDFKIIDGKTLNLLQTVQDQVELTLSAVDLKSKLRHDEECSIMKDGKPADKSNNSQKISEETSVFKDIRKMFSIRSFPLYIMGQTCSINGYLLLNIFLAPYAFDGEMSSSGVTTVMTTTGIIDMFARPLHGLFISSGFVNSNLYVGCLHLVASVVTSR